MSKKNFTGYLSNVFRIKNINTIFNNSKWEYFPYGFALTSRKSEIIIDIQYDV